MTDYAGRDVLMKFAVRRQADVEISGVGIVRLQSLTEKERAQILAKGTESPETVDARVIAATVIDERGYRIWSDDQLDQILSLDASVTMELRSAIDKHIAGRTIEDHGKNLSGTNGDASP